MEFNISDIIIWIVVAFGAATQRVTGIGFSLICAPLLVLYTHQPLHSVLLINFLCVLLNLFVLGQTWRNVNFRSISWLLVGAIVAVPLGQWAAQHVSTNWLMVGVGVLVLAGLIILQRQKALPVMPPVKSAIIAGALSGFMNVVAGVGGPAVVLYSSVQKWEQVTFVASIQAYFLIINAASVIIADPRQLDFAETVRLTTGLLAGILFGFIVVKRMNQEYAKKATLWIAGFGAAGTLIRGLVGLYSQH